MRIGGRPARELARTLAKQIAEHRIVDQGAQLAYYTLLGLFPFAIFLATLVGFLPIAGLADQLTALIDRVAPEAAAPLLVAAARNVVRGARPTLAAVGLAGALVSASGAVSALGTALNLAYGVPETRSWLRVRLRAAAITVVGAALIVVALTGFLVGPRLAARVAALLGAGRLFTVAWAILRWPATAMAMAGELAFLYYAVPNVTQPARRVLPGALVGAPLWILLSIGFNQYVRHFGHYNRTYGALGAGVILLLWFQLSSVIVLAGGELNAALCPRCHPRLHPRRETAWIGRWLRGRRRERHAST